MLATLATAALAAVNDHAAVDVYTHEQIQKYVETNFGGTSWNSLHGNQWVDDATREKYATEIVTGLVKKWREDMRFLPKVCEAG